jgi:hypothetical protein
MSRKKKPTGQKNNRCITRPSCVRSLANGSTVTHEQAAGSHEKLTHPRGVITFYETGNDAPYPRGTAAMLTRVCKAAGLLVLIATSIAAYLLTGG